MNYPASRGFLPFVSVIIPVLNDSQRLRTCLRSLENQTYPKDRYEIIVVDNGSDDDVEFVVHMFGQTRIIEEQFPGSYAARNKGLLVARGEVIAFTDSDCIPSPDWIERGVECLLSKPNCGFVGGRLDVFYRDPNKPTAIELYSSIVEFTQKGSIQFEKYSRTANLFVFTSVLQRVGPFDDRLRSGGDYAWGRRVSSLGYELVYADRARIAHPATYSFAQLYKKAARWEGGAHDSSRKGRRLTPSQPLSELLSSVVVVCLDKKLAVIQKMKVVFVVFLVRYVRAWERVRLLAGGRSLRD